MNEALEALDGGETERARGLSAYADQQTGLPAAGTGRAGRTALRSCRRTAVRPATVAGGAIAPRPPTRELGLPRRIRRPARISAYRARDRRAGRARLALHGARPPREPGARRPP